MKLTFKQILFSLLLAVCLSLAASLPSILTADDRKAQQAELVELHQQLSEALIHRDFATLQKLIADDFELHSILGDTMSKQKWIKNVQKGAMQYSQLESQKVKPIGTDEINIAQTISGNMWGKRGNGKSNSLSIPAITVINCKSAALPPSVSKNNYFTK